MANAAFDCLKKRLYLLPHRRCHVMLNILRSGLRHKGLIHPQLSGVLLNKDLQMFRLPLLLVCLAKEACGSEKKPRMLCLLGCFDAFLHPFQRAARVLIRRRQNRERERARERERERERKEERKKATTAEKPEKTPSHR